MSSARPSSRRFAVVAVLFVASGAAGLIDQFCFSKYLSYIVGSTAYAVSAVLSAFMLGMAIGAAAAGRVSSRLRRPLFAYGVLEIVVAAIVLLTPAAFGAISPAYVGLLKSAGADGGFMAGLVRWAMAMIVVILPTTAMGATLPLLSRLVELDVPADEDESRDVKARRLAILYACNTFGGAVGALAGAYLIVPALGLEATLFTAAGISGAVGLIAVGLGRQAEHASAATAPTKDEEVRPAAAAQPLLLGALALFSGWFVFAAEVVFTHLLALTIGNSAFAFGLILAVFLICLFVGATLAPSVAKRFGPSGIPLSLAATALALVATLPLWDQLPVIFQKLGPHVQSFAGREVVRALCAFVVLVLPTVAMGLTFPLVLQRAAETHRMAEDVGKLTAINTIGAVIGSLATGYFMLPLLGSERAIIAIAVVFALASVVSNLRDTSVEISAETPELLIKKRQRLALALATFSLVAAVLRPGWDLPRLTSGTNVYFEPYTPPNEIVSVEEDVHGGVTTVTRTGDVLTLLTNGKFQGNNSHEIDAQRGFAHYPSMFVDKFDRSLVIGLGTATTLGTLTAYPWQDIDAVEISPAIVRAAETHFSDVNRNSLNDPRVDLTLGDGRNFLLLSNQKYDLISMELSSIWFAGAAALYSREFYGLVASHLTERGIFQQWVQIHHLYPHDFATILNTLRMQFKHVALFYGGGQGILVAANRPLTVTEDRLAELEAHQPLAELLGDTHLSRFRDDILFIDEGVDAFLAEQAQLANVPLTSLVSTDDNLYLEYATPRGNVLPWSHREVLLKAVYKHRNVDGIMQVVTPSLSQTAR